MKLRCFAIVLCILLLAQSTVAASAGTDISYPVVGGNIYFSQATGAISGCDPYVTAAAVPSEIGGVPVTTVGKSAFQDCVYLSEVELPDSVTEIDNCAFLGCENLTRVVLPSALTRIGYGAFQKCGALAEITLPDTVNFIGSRAFYDCESLKSITIPSGVTAIEQWTFRGCTSLTTVSLPDALTMIGDSAFNSCIALTEIVLPQSLTAIGEWAFFNCRSLTDIAIPAAVESIGEFAFYACRSLNGIWVEAENTVYCSDASGVLFSKDGSFLLQAPGALNGEYAVPTSVTVVGESAFRECEELTGIQISKNVTLIGESAFYGCTALKSVSIPESVSFVPKHAFQYCKALETLVLPQSIVEIKEDAFFGCEGLKNVCFLGAAPQIGRLAFGLCHDKLTLYYLDGQDGWTPDWNGYATALWDGEHSYFEEIIPPTCLMIGYTLHTCRICGETYYDNETEPLGHETAIIEGVEPTCTENGISEGRVCVLCDTIIEEQRTLAPLGHDYNEWQEVSSATCTDAGQRCRVCTRCNAEEVESIVALGHDYQNGKCTRCGKTNGTSVSFKDVAKTAWYKEAVDYAVSNGLMNGMGNNKFEPDTETNRAMLVTILWRYAGSPVEGKNTFKDVKSGQWYTEAVTWAAKNGIVTGVGNNKFDPEGKLTREQLATILFRYSKQLGLNTSARADFGKFADGKKVQSWSKESVQWAVAEGIIGGTSENGKLYLDPQGNATRAQVATILMRFIENVLKK